MPTIPSEESAVSGHPDPTSSVHQGNVCTDGLDYSDANPAASLSSNTSIRYARRAGNPMIQVKTCENCWAVPNPGRGAKPSHHKCAKKNPRVG